MLTVRFYFGQDSLIANDRKGASLADYNPWYGAEAVAEPYLGDRDYTAPFPESPPL
ncbi:MAG TPA: hypothetical protein VMU01_07435 [Rhizomicrobium sp.]|nr:hypothetical protein [Rhizomicrobium sp.]